MPRILLVDDDDSLRAMLCKALQKAGYEVQDASNGNGALESYRKQSADLVITDLVMPDKEGLETIMELRRINPDLKIIAISGGGRIDPRVTLPIARKLGACRTLAKPFSTHELLNAVAEVLAQPSPSLQAGIDKICGSRH